MSRDLLTALAEALGPAKVVTDGAALEARRHDYWMVSHARDLAGAGAPRPACLVRPQSAADVSATLRIAASHGAPVIPFGLGSGVVGGVLALEGAIVLDIGAMTATRFIDRVNLLACFDAGKRGSAAEGEVAAQGLTIGHWPQSVAVSSVGGWVATRASGQFSTAYGNIEDMVHSIEAVLPDGGIVTLGKAPRASAGPDLRHLMLGSEGCLGVVTGVTLALRRAPQARARAAFEVADMAQGFELQRQIIQSGWLPAVVRQYDAHEARRLDPEGQSCLILFIHEGPAGLVAAQDKAVKAMSVEAGARRASPTIVETWLARRNEVPPWERILARNIVADTVEIAAPWDRIGAVYQSAIASLREVEGLLAASAHSSHAYRTGLSLYFTFAVQTAGLAAMEDAYFDCWRRIMQAAVAQGGGISHHHGIGRVRRPYLESDLGASGVALLRRVKQALDPAGIMNPGVLIPDA